MKEEPIEICVIANKKLFNEQQIENMEMFGPVIFYRKNNYETLLSMDKSKKIIVYDPDFGGWEFSDTLLTGCENILAIFLGTTDKSYINLYLCDKLNIPVYNIPRYAGDSVAEYLVMYMFACAKKLPLQLKNENRQEFDDVFVQMQLKNKKVGIVGLGNIGSKIAEICDGIGMNVSYWNRRIKQSDYEYVPLKKLFKTCDVIFLCLSINDDTKKIVTDELLESMKKNTIFISCTGKQLFNYKIIEQKMKKNELFGFALEEPDISLNQYKGNTLVTSEYAWFTEDAVKQRSLKLYEEIVEFFCNKYGYSVSKFISKNVSNISRSIFCNIRKATKEDMPEIAKLYMEQEWFGEDNSVKKMKENYDPTLKNFILLVAEYKGKVIGTVAANINYAVSFNCMRFITFDYLVVKKEYRRRKVGTQLMEALFRIAEKEKLESVWGVASTGRKRTQEFFDKVGLDDPVIGFRKIYIDESVVI